MPADDGIERHEIERMVSAWSAEHLVEEAARSRSRRHWIGRRQAEESNLASLFSDLAEARMAVALTTRSGSTYRGVVEDVRQDWVTVAAAPGPALIRMSAVTVVETAERVTMSGRRATPAGSLA